MPRIRRRSRTIIRHGAGSVALSIGGLQTLIAADAGAFLITGSADLSSSATVTAPPVTQSHGGYWTFYREPFHSFLEPDHHRLTAQSGAFKIRPASAELKKSRADAAASQILAAAALALAEAQAARKRRLIIDANNDFLMVA